MADVLLVDDNGSVLLTLAIALRRYGHLVTVAGDARQALNHLQRHRFAFLVSDVRMAGMSGMELAAQARQLPHPPRIILMSAYSNIEAHEGLAEAFLRKPIDIQELHALLCGQSAATALPDTSVSGRNGSEGNSPAMAASEPASLNATPGAVSVRISTTARSSSPTRFQRGAESDSSTHEPIAGRSTHASYGIVFG